MAEYFGELVPAYDMAVACNLVAGRIYYVELEGSPTGAGTLPDGVLNLYSTYWVTRSGEPWMEVGERLASDDDGGVGYNARIVFTPPATDWLYRRGRRLRLGLQQRLVRHLPAAGLRG